MSNTEWIVSIDDDMKDYDEIFVGNVRDGDMLIRCRYCENYAGEGWYCAWNMIASAEGFCFHANEKPECADD